MSVSEAVPRFHCRGNQAHRSVLGRTTDGAPIIEGTVVFTNESEAGIVRTDWSQPWWDGWFDVEYADGRRIMQNAERVTTRLGGRLAADEWTGARRPESPSAWWTVRPSPSRR